MEVKFTFKLRISQNGSQSLKGSLTWLVESRHFCYSMPVPILAA